MGQNRLTVIIVFTSTMSLGFGVSMVLGGETKMSERAIEKNVESGEKEEGLAIKDLPAPIPNVIDEIQRIGNEVGEGITKATGETADAIKKAFLEKNAE